MIELRMLGVTELRVGETDQSRSLVAHPRLLGLLGYLCAARPYGAHTRDELVAMFWPEVDQDHARASLRKAIHRLRGTLGQQAIIGAGGEAVGIPDSVLWCDVAAFHKNIDSGNVIDALELYRGDFLPGFFLGDAPQFERWLDSERNDLRAAAARAAWAASDEAQVSGDTAACARWARYAARLSPDDEQAARRLISTLDTIGDRTGALRAYDDFERYLAAELDVSPSKATFDLAATIRSRVDCVRHRVPGPPAINLKDEPSPERAKADPAPASPGNFHYGTIVTGLIVMAAVAFAFTALSRNSTASARASAPPDLNRVAVMVPENATGRPDLDFVGLEIQDWVTRGIQETGLGQVFPVQSEDGRIAPTTSSSKTREDEREWAARLRVGTMLKGRYYLRGDSLLMQMSIVSPVDGHVVGATNSVSGPVSDPTSAVDALRRKTIAVLATEQDPALAQWARSASQPPSFESYREFSEGLQARNRDDYEEAVAKFERASSLDPTYVYPLIMAAEIEVDRLNNIPKGDSLLRAVRQRSRHLAPFDEAYAATLEAERSDDFEKMFQQSERLRRFVTPGSEWELYPAIAAVALNRPIEAMKAAKAFDLHRPAALDSRNVFFPIARAYHLAGENAALLELLERNAGKWQRAPFVVAGKIQALAALSRPKEAIALWRTLLHRNVRDADVLAMWAAKFGTAELRAHGSREAARALAIEALDSLPDMPSTAHFGEPLFIKMRVLWEAGRMDEAAAIARARAIEDPKDPFRAAEYASLLAKTGHSQAARDVQARLERWKPDPLNDVPEILLARAFVAATLGEKAGAVKRLRAACERGCEFAFLLHTMTPFDGLLDYPPFQELLKPRQ